MPPDPSSSTATTTPVLPHRLLPSSSSEPSPPFLRNGLLLRIQFEHHVIIPATRIAVLSLARRNELSTLKRRLMHILFTVQLFLVPHPDRSAWYKKYPVHPLSPYSRHKHFSSHGQSDFITCDNVFHRKRPR